MRAPRFSMRKSFRKGTACNFTLVELLVAMSVLVVLGLLLFQMLVMATNTWKAGRAQADNFSQARAVLDLIARDIESGVFRRDLPSFYLQGNPALAFYTRQMGLRSANRGGNRPLSLVSYTVTSIGGTNSVLRRTMGGFNYGDAIDYNPSSWTLAPSASAFSSDIGPGVLAFKYQFIGTNGWNVLPDQINPAWTNSPSKMGIESLRAVVISLAVMDGESIRLLGTSGQLDQLCANFSTNNPGAVRSFRSQWQNQLDDATRPLATGNIPLKSLQGLRLFERTVMLPHLAGQ